MRRFFFVTALIMGVLVLVGLILIPAMTQHYYGSPSPDLSTSQVFQYSLRLLWDDGLVTKPLDPNGREQEFTVEQGESVESIADRLQQAGVIRDAGALRDYLISMNTLPDQPLIAMVPMLPRYTV